MNKSNKLNTSWLFIGASIALAGCATGEGLLSPSYSVVQKQADADKPQETVVRFIRPAGPSASYWNLRFHPEGEVPVRVPVNLRGHGQYQVLGDGGRALAVEFDCDYTKGETRGSAFISFEGPQWDGSVAVRCVPMSPEEVALQRAEKAEKRRLAAEADERKKRAEADRLEMQKAAERQREEQARARKAEQERLAALKETPEYKMREAAQQVRAAQRFIDDAERAMANEREIGRVSGYVNAARLREAGSMIVFYRNMQGAQWKIYKANGGKAISIDALLRGDR